MPSMSDPIMQPAGSAPATSAPTTTTTTTTTTNSQPAPSRAYQSNCTLAGNIIDKQAGMPALNAIIELKDGQGNILVTTLTDINGYFSIGVDAGSNYSLHARQDQGVRTTYRNIRNDCGGLGEGATINLNLEL